MKSDWPSERLGHEQEEGAFWLEGCGKEAGRGWASDLAGVWGAGGGAGRIEIGGVTRMASTVGLTGLFCGKGSHQGPLCWGWGQRADFRQVNWKQTPGVFLG